MARTFNGQKDSLAYCSYPGVRVAGDKDAKEIRRVAKKLGIRLAEDERGRKLKWPYPPKEPKQPLGRPRTKPDIRFVSDLEAIEARK